MRGDEIFVKVSDDEEILIIMTPAKAQWLAQWLANILSFHAEDFEDASARETWTTVAKGLIDAANQINEITHETQELNNTSTGTQVQSLSMQDFLDQFKGKEDVGDIDFARLVQRVDEAISQTEREERASGEDKG